MKVKIDDVGKILIPVYIRKELNLKPKDELELKLNDNEIIVSKINKFDISNYIKEKINEDISSETKEILIEILERI